MSNAVVLLIVVVEVVAIWSCWLLLADPVGLRGKGVDPGPQEQRRCCCSTSRCRTWMRRWCYKMIVANLSSSNGNINVRNSDNYASNSSSSVRSSISRSSGISSGSCTLGYSSAQ